MPPLRSDRDSGRVARALGFDAGGIRPWRPSGGCRSANGGHHGTGLPPKTGRSSTYALAPTGSVARRYARSQTYRPWTTEELLVRVSAGAP